MTVVKTYKLEPETIQNLQKICEELGLTWDGTFTTLANLYAQQKAIGTLPERGTEIKEFQSLLNQISASFTHALQINANTDARIRQEFAQRLAVQDTALQQAQQEAAAAKKNADMSARDLQAAQHDKNALSKENQQLQEKLAKADALQQKNNQAAAAALKDKEHVNQLLAAQIAKLQQENAALQEAKAAQADIQQQVKELASSLRQEREKHQQARQELQQMQAVLTENENQHQIEKKHYDEQLQLQQAQAAAEKQAALLQVKADAMEQLETMRQKYTEELDRVYQQLREAGFSFAGNAEKKEENK